MDKSKARKKILDASQRKTNSKSKVEVANTTRAINIDKTRKFLKDNFEFRYNSIANEIEIRNKKFKEKTFRKIEDYDFNSINIDLDLKGIHIPENKLRQLLLSDYISERYDPIKEYLFSLEPWDEETDHIKNFFNQLLLKNQSDYEYLLKCFKKWYSGSVMSFIEDEPEPFYVNQVALILLSKKQGKYKSTWLGSIIPQHLRLQYYYPNSFNVHNKDHIKYLATKMLINLDEMETYNKTDIGTMKSVITIPQITIRLPYGRIDINAKRRASFCGSINEATFLRDNTGSRRWIVIEIDGIAYESNYNVDGMYSQALYLLRNGFQYWFDGSDIAELEKRNQEYTQPSLEEELLLSMFDIPVPGDDPSLIRKMTTSEIATAICREHERLNVNSSFVRALGSALTKHDFPKTSSRENSDKSPVRVYKVKPILGINNRITEDELNSENIENDDLF